MSGNRNKRALVASAAYTKDQHHHYRWLPRIGAIAVHISKPLKEELPSVFHWRRLVMRSYIDATL